MNATERFINKVKDFLASTGMAESTFGRKALGDSTFVYRLYNGRSPSLETAEKVEQFMKSERKYRK